MSHDPLTVLHTIQPPSRATTQKGSEPNPTRRCRPRSTVCLPSIVHEPTEPFLIYLHRPDPYSNIRPIIYASTPPSRGSNNSPYSTGEFPYAKDSTRLEDLELEWRLSRERVDMMNHRFWVSRASVSSRWLPSPPEAPDAHIACAEGRR